MGLVSNDLKNIVDKLGDAKNSINSKYEIMRANNSTSPQNDLDHLYINDLSPSIDRIECLNTYGIEVDPKEVLEGTVVFSQGRAIEGQMEDYGCTSTILHEERPTLDMREGHYDESIIKIQLQEKTAKPGIGIQIIEPDEEHVLSRVFVDSVSVQQKSARPTKEPQDIKPDPELFLSNVHIEGDEDLIPDNIKKGVSIFGVNGAVDEILNYNVVYIANEQGQQAYIQQVPFNEEFDIIPNVPESIYGNEFKGWNPNPTSNTPTYIPNQHVSGGFTGKGDVYLLYAVWEEGTLSEITLDFEYANNGKLDSNTNLENVIMTVHGGCKPDGSYTNVTREIICEDYHTINKFTSEGPEQYTCDLSFNEIGFYPIIVTHTNKKGDQTTANGVIKIMGNNGNMSDTGQMVFESKGSWYDSGWINTDITKGCYVSQVTYRFKSGNGHSSTHDKLAIFGKKTDGTIIVLYDFGNTSNINKTVDVSNLGTNEMIGDSYAIVLGDVTLTSSNLSSTQWNINENYTKEQDIRQVRFFAYSDHDQSCFSTATIDFDVQFEFDMDIWMQDKNM